MMALLTLFGVSFLAGSFFPLGSEPLFLYQISQGQNYWSSLLIASMGNTLGGMTCYFIARYGGIILVEKYLKIEKSKIDKWRDRLLNKGEYSAILCWLPIVGEIIAATLGFFSLNTKKVCIYMFVGKFLRYAFILYMYSVVQ